MSKAFLLVKKMPKTCYKCKLWYTDLSRGIDVCCPCNKVLKWEEKKHKPKWCPLKKWPKKRIAGFIAPAPGYEGIADMQNSLDLMFNSFIRELEKDKPNYKDIFILERSENEWESPDTAKPKPQGKQSD